MLSRMKRFTDIFFEKPKSFPEAVFFLLRCLFLIVFFWIFLNAVFSNPSSMYRFDMPLASAVALAVLVAALYFTFKLKKFISTHAGFGKAVHKYSALIALAGLAVLFVFQLTEAHGIYRPVGWDCGNIVGCAVKGDLSSQRFYFSTYPNNLLMYCILKVLLKGFFHFGGTNYWLFLSVVNILLIDFAVFLVFLVCKKLFGLACGFVSYALFILIFGFSPWIVVPYSDTFSMFFTPLILLLFLYFQSAKNPVLKFILLFCIGFFTVAGYYIKPYVVIVSIAIFIYLVIHSINSIKKIGICLLTLAVIASGAVCSGYAYQVKVKEPYTKVLDYSAALPMSYFFMMGLNTAVSKGTGKALYGAYSGQDNLFAYSLPTPQAKQSETMRVALERIRNYTPKGYAQFLSNKANWVFSDGTFWVEGEGYDVDTPSSSTTGFSKWIQSIFRFYGSNYSCFAEFAQGIWILLLFLLICPLFNNGGDFKKAAVNILRIAVLGFLLYQLLFEARSRYIIAILPVIIMLAGSGFANFHENFYSYQESDLHPAHLLK